MSSAYSAGYAQTLASQAELLFRGNLAARYVFRKNSSEGDSEDSDYQSRILADSFMSSEPNIHKRQVLQKINLGKKKDFHQSLPGHLDYLKPLPFVKKITRGVSYPNTPPSSDLSSPGRSFSLSSPSVSDLWEQVNLTNLTYESHP